MKSCGTLADGIQAPTRCSLDAWTYQYFFLCKHFRYLTFVVFADIQDFFAALHYTVVYSFIVFLFVFLCLH